MSAVCPDRRPSRHDVRTHDGSRLLIHTLRPVTIVAALLGFGQSSWGQSDAQQSAIQFVGKVRQPAPTKAIATPAQTKTVNKPELEAPLSVADYKDYIKTRGSVSASTPEGSAFVPSPPVTQRSAPTTRKGLEPVSAVEPIAVEPAELTQKIAFAVPAAPGYETLRVAKKTAPKSQPTVTAARPQVVEPVAATALNSASNNPPEPNRAEVSKDSQIAVVRTYTAERRTVTVAPAPPPRTQPAQPAPKVETAPPTVESMPMNPVDAPPVPLTTSSYLPANPEEYCFRCGVMCPGGCNPGGPGWAASRPIPWEVFAQGEYVGPARLAHVPIYRLRVDDQLAFVYRLSGQTTGQAYRLNVRDRLQVQSLSAPEIVTREVMVQPDGTITLPLLGQVRASGATLEELARQLDEQYKNQIRDPRITVTPLVMNSNLEELRSSVDRRYGQGGQVSTARVSPDGTIQLPAIGLVPAQGLTVEELEREIKARYALIVEGLEVTPILTDRAPRFVYVIGEVQTPGRFTMEGPTTLMQAIAMAGSWNVGAGLNEVVVFRRDENWQLMATKVNIRTSLLFKKPCPAGEIWLRDSDIVLVPKSPILCADDVINLVFTRGIYGVFPMSATLNFSKLTTL